MLAVYAQPEEEHINILTITFEDDSSATYTFNPKGMFIWNNVENIPIKSIFIRNHE